MLYILLLHCQGRFPLHCLFVLHRPFVRREQLLWVWITQLKDLKATEIFTVEETLNMSQQCPLVHGLS